MDFNESKDSYRSTIENSLKFSGKNLDFFVSVKADFLNQIIKKFLPHVKKPKLLDVGCGHGFIHPYLQKNECEVVGVEMAGEVLELARKENPQVLYLHHDGETLPFESETFDVAIAICVMHHVPTTQWNNFLVEMKRVLTSTGIVIIFEHNPYNPITRHIVSKNILDHDAILLPHTHLEGLMRTAGFKVAKSRFILFTPFAQRIFRWLDKCLGWCPLGAQYYTVATQ